MTFKSTCFFHYNPPLNYETENIRAFIKANKKNAVSYFTAFE